MRQHRPSAASGGAVGVEKSPPDRRPCHGNRVGRRRKRPLLTACLALVRCVNTLVASPRSAIGCTHDSDFGAQTTTAGSALPMKYSISAAADTPCWQVDIARAQYTEVEHQRFRRSDSVCGNAAALRRFMPVSRLMRAVAFVNVAPGVALEIGAGRAAASMAVASRLTGNAARSAAKRFSLFICVSVDVDFTVGVPANDLRLLSPVFALGRPGDIPQGDPLVTNLPNASPARSGDFRQPFQIVFSSSSELYAFFTRPCIFAITSGGVPLGTHSPLPG